MPSRRSFLVFALGLLPWTPGIAWSAQRISQSADSTRLLALLVSDPNAASAIGRDALDLYPALLDHVSVGGTLARLGALPEHSTPVEIATVRVRYQAILCEDFAASRTIDVRGWQLARTEVQVFAMLAVRSPSIR
jgi:hypothetical protein